MQNFRTQPTANFKRHLKSHFYTFLASVVPDVIVRLFNGRTPLLHFMHMRSQGFTGCTCTPQGGEKNWGPNLQGKVVSAPQAEEGSNF